MKEKLHPTLPDYVAIAINPVLVMGLVGSLVYFLLELLYLGNYPDRLQFSLTMFVLAIVLISRISMEDGFEHAAPYGIALAIVVGLALNRYIDYRGGRWASLGWLINWGLMALTWGCAHKLTQDSTAIDEREEAAGEGLLQTVGLESAGDQPQSGATGRAVATGKAAANGTPADPRNSSTPAQPSASKKHPPGLWVVYFSLASLPIFGIGQLFIPANKIASRRYVFLLLIVYVACGLGLLLTTSFLSLRRYLRQRYLEMPPLMAGNWLTTGAMLIVILLVVVAVLPRPNPEYDISALPSRLREYDQPSSRFAVGREGTIDKAARQGAGVDHAPRPSTEKAAGSSGSDPQQSSQPNAKQPASSGGQEKSSAANPRGAASQQNSPGAKEGGQSGGNQQPADSSDQGKGAGEKNSAQGAGGSQDSDKTQQEKGARQAGQKPGGSEEPPPGKRPQQSAHRPIDARPAESARPAQSSATDWGSRLAELGKWLVYLAFLAAAGWGAWQQREKLLAAWRDFWQHWFGRKRARSQPAAAAEAARPAVRQRAFAEFVDPFAAGTAASYSLPELVRYTFAALEAWARDHGCPREPDETPHEFTARLSAQDGPLPTAIRTLADCYCRAIYSTSQLPAEARGQLSAVWRHLPHNTVAAQAELRPGQGGRR